MNWEACLSSVVVPIKFFPSIRDRKKLFLHFASDNFDKTLNIKKRKSFGLVIFNPVFWSWIYIFIKFVFFYFIFQILHSRPIQKLFLVLDAHAPIELLGSFHRYFKNVWQFIQKCLVAESNADVWHICASNVVTRNAFTSIVGSKPMLFHFMWESWHCHAVPCQLTHITWRQLPNLRRNAVLFHQRFLCEVELKGIIGWEWYDQPSGKILGQWVAMIV